MEKKEIDFAKWKRGKVNCKTCRSTGPNKFRRNE